MQFTFSSSACTFIRTFGNSKRMVSPNVFILGGLGTDIESSSGLKRFVIRLGVLLSLICLYRHKSLTVNMSAILRVSNFLRRGMVWELVPDPVRARIAFFCILVRFPGDLPHSAIP